MQVILHNGQLMIKRISGICFCTQIIPVLSTLIGATLNVLIDPFGGPVPLHVFYGVGCLYDVIIILIYGSVTFAYNLLIDK